MDPILRRKPFYFTLPPRSYNYPAIANPDRHWLYAHTTISVVDCLV